MQAPAGFVVRHEGPYTIWLLPEDDDDLGRLLRDFLEGNLREPARSLAGGRGGALAIDLPGGGIVLRRSLRGGFPARVVADLYLGRTYRPLHELAMTEVLRERGVRVPRCLGAIVRSVGSFWYRGAVATQEIPSSITLWEHLRRTPSAHERELACRAAVHAVEAMHAAGVVHPDLNLFNLLVTGVANRPDVWIIDCDGVAWAQPRARERAWRRMRRSARKLDPEARLIEPSWLDPGGKLR
jgi:hypothetical protein